MRGFGAAPAKPAPAKGPMLNLKFSQEQLDCIYAGGKIDPKTGKCDTQDWKYFAKIGGAVVAAYLVYKLATR